MLPPLLPLKFGNGLVLQYTVNTPGQDDKLGLLEVGLGVGVTSLALVLLSAVASYMLKSVPLLVEMEDRKRKTVARLLRMFDIAVGVLQVVLLLVLFIFTVFYYNTAEFTHAESEYYVTKIIYMFSFVISCVMFLSIVAILCPAMKSLVGTCRVNTTHLFTPFMQLTQLALFGRTASMCIVFSTLLRLQTTGRRWTTVKPE